MMLRLLYNIKDDREIIPHQMIASLAVWKVLQAGELLCSGHMAFFLTEKKSNLSLRCGNFRQKAGKLSAFRITKQSRMLLHHPRHQDSRDDLDGFLDEDWYDEVVAG